MKLILPQTPEFNNNAEEAFYQYFINYFSDGWLAYYNYEINMHEFDFLLISPQGNVFLLEVKGYTKNSKITVLDNETYKINGLIQKSPKKQVLKYMYELNGILKLKYLNPFICTVVCYPYINEHSFQSNALDKMSTRVETLLLEDFESKRIEHHLNTLLTSSKNRGASFMRLNEADLLDFRRIFETDETLNIRIWNNKNDMVDSNHVFSVLQIKNSFTLDEKKQLYSKWLSGTKLYLLCPTQDILNEIYDYFFIASKENTFFFERFFDDTKKSIFNVSLSLYNGQNFDYDYSHGLEKVPNVIIDDIRKHSKFNMEQYLLVHDRLNENILVTAGAGTGKTYSMINRIALILYEFNVSKRSCSELKHLFAMMTFTREAADNMKRRIKEYLNNMFILTGRDFFLDCINEIPNIQITTIHSYVKSLLNDISLYIGYGKNLKVSSSEFAKKNLTTKYIDDEIYLMDIMKQYNINHYEMNDLIRTFYSQLKQKNIDLGASNTNFDTASIVGNTKKIADGIIRIIKRVDNDIKELNKKKGQIDLSDLMLFLSIYLKKNGGMKNYLEYMFIDEFQDTDDLQIEIITVLQKAFEFKLFIVGDIKQCIYRFRGAEDQAFTRIRERVDYLFLERELRYNYRSTEGLIRNINELSSRLSRKKLLNFQVSDILLSPFCGPQNKADFIYYSDEKERIRFIVKNINDHKGDGNTAVLVRYNSEVKYWKEILEKEGLDVVTEVPNNFYGEIAVIEFYKLVKALLSQNNVTDCYQLMLTSYYRKLPLQPNELNQINPGEQLFDWWEKIVKDIKLYPAIRVLHEIIYNERPWEVHSQSYGEYSRENEQKKYKLAVEMLLESLLQSFEVNYITLEKIEEFLRIKIFTSNSDIELFNKEVLDNKNSVNIMTIHKSKGLEFDYVLIPNMNSAINRNITTHPVEVIIKDHEEIKHIGFKLRLCKEFSIQNSIYNDFVSDEREDIEKEEARLLYVAMTRAQKELAFFISSKSTGANSCYAKMIGV